MNISRQTGEPARQCRRGNCYWKTVIENFYPDLEKAVEAAEKDLEKVKIEDEVSRRGLRCLWQKWL